MLISMEEVMFKKGIVLFLVLSLMMPMGAAFAAETVNASVSDIKLTVDEVAIDKDIYVIDGASYLPLKEVSNALDLNVEWKGDIKTIALTSKSNGIEAELLELAEMENEKLEEEIEMLKALLVKNGIKVPRKDSVVKYLEDEIKLLSKRPRTYSMSVSTAYKGEDRVTDNLGNEFSSYILMNIHKSFNGGTGTTYITYPAQGQYDMFKASLSAYNIKNKPFKHELVIFADDKEVYRTYVSSEDTPKDIEVGIKNAQTVTYEMRAEDGSNFGGILLGNPRFTIN